MDSGAISKTALNTCFYRAYHFEHDSPKVFEDSVAGSLLTADEKESIEASMIATLARTRGGIVPDVERSLLVSEAVHANASTGAVLARFRWAEDWLHDAMERGISQYVILGAGLDTFALRQRDRAGHVTIIEVDTAAMQASKRQRIAMAGLVTPQNLHFCAVNFERDDLGAVLRDSSHDPARPTFFSWLGVTQYLTRSAIEQTFRSMREVSAAGSEIVFTYLDEKWFAPEHQISEIRAIFERNAGLGEPFLTGFAPSLLASQLAPLGFKLDENLEGPQQEERYFLNRNDGLRPTGIIAFAHAFAC